MIKNYDFIAVDFNPFEGNEIKRIAVTNESQQEIWSSCIIGENDANCSYNLSISLGLKGPFKRNSLEKALLDLTERH